MKKLLVIAVATALIAPAAAMADTTLYGKVHATVGNVETVTKGVETSETVVESHDSRFGIKGSTSLDNGLSATYGLELDVNLDEKGTVGANRNKFVGLKGGFGEIRVGTHDTPGKLATAGLDAFGDTYGDMKNIISSDGDRVNNVVAYINKFGPVGFAAAHSTNVGGDDATTAENAANTLMANYSTGPFYGALGVTAIDDTAETTKANIGLGYKSEAGHFVNYVSEGVVKDGTPAADDEANVYLAGGFKIGAATLKGAVGVGERDGAGEETQATLGVDYSLGKKTSAYLLLNDNTNIGRVATGTEDSKSAAVVGLVSEF
ncbi:MAG: porin [Candidatus Thiothrix sulfatifontis]|nr:MAG: porin [Candidatus Thiothrix sulfatifontis]